MPTSFAAAAAESRIPGPPSRTCSRFADCRIHDPPGHENRTHSRLSDRLIGVRPPDRQVSRSSPNPTPTPCSANAGSVATLPQPCRTGSSHPGVGLAIVVGDVDTVKPPRRRPVRRGEHRHPASTPRARDHTGATRAGRPVNGVAQVEALITMQVLVSFGWPSVNPPALLTEGPR